MRNFIAAAILCLVGGSAQAQYFYQPWAYQRGPNLGGVQYLGNVGNIPVFNPWNMYDNQNYSGYLYPVYPRYRSYYPPVYQPILYPPVWYPRPIPYYPAFSYSYNFGPYGTYTASSNPYVPAFQGVNPGFGIEREAGRFIPVNNTTAVNNLTGTVLNPVQGVAYTNDGTFYRLGQGSITAFGAFNAGTGAYYNPISGDLYNPGTGVIVRR